MRQNSTTGKRQYPEQNAAKQTPAKGVQPPQEIVKPPKPVQETTTKPPLTNKLPAKGQPVKATAEAVQKLNKILDDALPANSDFQASSEPIPEQYLDNNYAF